MTEIGIQIQSTSGTSGGHHLVVLVTALSSLLQVRRVFWLMVLSRAHCAVSQRMFIYNPDSFVNPRNWIIHASTITQALRESHMAGLTSRSPNATWGLEIESDLDDIARRNDALLFRTIPERAMATARFTMTDVKVQSPAFCEDLGPEVVSPKLLNSITEMTNVSTITILDMSLDESEGFSNKLDMLLTWSITPHQYGDHRPYAVATLLSQWRDRSEDRALRRGLSSPHELLQDHLFDWLDASDVVLDASNLSAMAITFDELIGRGLFSYPKYIQRLIARGEQGLQVTQVE